MFDRPTPSPIMAKDNIPDRMKTKCNYCDKSYVNIKAHTAKVHKRDMDGFLLEVPEISDVKPKTTTEYLRELLKYMEDNKDVAYFNNYRNAIKGVGKNGKYQQKLIRDTIIFLKELKVLP